MNREKQGFYIGSMAGLQTVVPVYTNAFDYQVDGFTYEYIRVGKWGYPGRWPMVVTSVLLLVFQFSSSMAPWSFGLLYLVSYIYTAYGSSVRCIFCRTREYFGFRCTAQILRPAEYSTVVARFCHGQLLRMIAYDESAAALMFSWPRARLLQWVKCEINKKNSNRKVCVLDACTYTYTNTAVVVGTQIYYVLYVCRIMSRGCLPWWRRVKTCLGLFHVCMQACRRAGWRVSSYSVHTFNTIYSTKCVINNDFSYIYMVQYQ